MSGSATMRRPGLKARCDASVRLLSLFSYVLLWLRCEAVHFLLEDIMTTWRMGLSGLGLFVITLALGCESHMGAKRDTPSQAGPSGQQGVKDGHSTMEHDKGGDKMIK